MLELPGSTLPKKRGAESQGGGGGKRKKVADADAAADGSAGAGKKLSFAGDTYSKFEL